MKPRIGLSLLLVTAMVVVGCGSGDDSPTPLGSDQVTDDGRSNDGGVGNGADETSGGAIGGEGTPESVMAGFPVEIPGGWEIDIQGEIGMTDSNAAQLLYTADAFDTLVAFYDDWTESQSEEYARTEVDNKVIYTGIDSSVYSITITPDEEQRDQTWALLQVITSGE